MRTGPLMRLVCSHAFLQFVEISQRVAQAVDVINAQTRARSFRYQPQDVSVRGLEHEGVFDPHPHQVGDRKKTAIVDAFIQVLPKRELVVLLGQQTLKGSETGSVALLSVNL